jgi:hypothetical protein
MPVLTTVDRSGNTAKEPRMNPSNDVQRSPRNRFVDIGRALCGALVFAGGLLAAGVFSTAVPAAPQDCLPPPVGCVTTSLPPVPSVPLPTVTVPPLPTTTTGTSTGGTTTGTSTGATDTTSTEADAPSARTAGLAVHASVRVRGHGARRVVEIRLRLSQGANVSALLRRHGGTLVRRLFSARAGSSVTILRVPRKTKPGAATLALVYRAVSGDRLQASYRLRLPS